MSCLVQMFNSLEVAVQQTNSQAAHMLNPALQQARGLVLQGRNIAPQVEAKIAQAQEVVKGVIRDTQGVVRQVLGKVQETLQRVAQSADSRKFQEETNIALALSQSLADEAAKVQRAQVIIRTEENGGPQNQDQEAAQAIALSHGQ